MNFKQGNKAQLYICGFPKKHVPPLAIENMVCSQIVANVF
jgi:hypothetical protein